jgi:hypothetical protein
MAGLRRKPGKTSPGGGRKPRRRRGRFPWEDWPVRDLLDLRLCDLGLTLEGSWLEELTGRVQAEIDKRNLRLRPHFWLSDEWFCPHGVPGIAIPFYLVHPRLIMLERRMMLEVEGGTREECMKLLRHEAGHALQHAYRLNRRRRWQRIFGKSSEPYPDFYRPDPASKSYVYNLDAWYAQSHPDEDFAETFAVWLKPRSAWRRKYAGWPALQKLEYVEELMEELDGTRPACLSRRKPFSLPTLRMTLREHYEKKRERYSVGQSDHWDRDLLRLFSQRPEHRGWETAASFLRRNRREIREIVARWTGEYQFTLDQVLKGMIGRCKELKLRAVGTERQLKLDFAILLTVHTTQYLYGRREWHAV